MSLVLPGKGTERIIKLGHNHFHFLYHSLSCYSTTVLWAYSRGHIKFTTLVRYFSRNVKKGRWVKWKKGKWSWVRLYTRSAGNMLQCSEYVIVQWVCDSAVNMFIISNYFGWEGYCTVFNLIYNFLFNLTHGLLPDMDRFLCCVFSDLYCSVTL
jgi:hypothetical protein